MPAHRTDPEKCLHEAEWGEKKIYLEACLQQRRHFSPFFALVDGMMGVEATATLKRIASRLDTKWKQSYSKTCRYVKSRIAITLVRAILLLGSLYADPVRWHPGSSYAAVCGAPPSGISPT